MKKQKNNESSPETATATTEMLLLPDGRLLVHNLTPKMARLLHELNPDDTEISPRSQPKTEHATRNIP
jgi:hypothetical protein